MRTTIVTAITVLAGVASALPPNVIVARSTHSNGMGGKDYKAGRGSGTPKEEWQKGVLAAHNKEREACGQSPLVWNDELCNDSQSYCESCKYGHSGGDGYGENIAQGGGSGGGYSGDDLCKLWSDEKDGKHGDDGHYTQMVWKDTTDVGCGLQKCGGQNYIVCRYYPAGNVIGQEGSQVCKGGQPSGGAPSAGGYGGDQGKSPSGGSGYPSGGDEGESPSGGYPSGGDQGEGPSGGYPSGGSGYPSGGDTGKSPSGGYPSGGNGGYPSGGSGGYPSGGNGGYPSGGDHGHGCNAGEHWDDKQNCCVKDDDHKHKSCNAGEHWDDGKNCCVKDDDHKNDHKQSYPVPYGGDNDKDHKKDHAQQCPEGQYWTGSCCEPNKKDDDHKPVPYGGDNDKDHKNSYGNNGGYKSSDNDKDHKNSYGSGDKSSYGGISYGSSDKDSKNSYGGSSYGSSDDSKSYGGSSYGSSDDSKKSSYGSGSDSYGSKGGDKKSYQ